ncbi:hypothetical protein VNO80_25915 [Phaseolus coccineus]|uniref:Bet v I/Major latex protein domain-containing protein n=1 Tax=Phaseolus coccineus TaxID=3886 RepID=A0AAN9LW48_PHACN
MSLSGKISTELPVHATADKWFHTFTNQLHHIQHVADKVHGAKLHEEGKAVTCHESIESVDEQKKRIVFKIYGEAIDDKYKVFKFTFEAIERDDGRAAIKCSVEYEKISEEVHPPYAYLEFYDHVIKDVDAYLLKAEKSATK